ncbi:MAG: hypothetical protein MET45_00430 [Nostoc sp. LLA-1]|nr:hypothetical protein [Cyanocohniella sp. LLY]
MVKKQGGRGQRAGEKNHPQGGATAVEGFPDLSGLASSGVGASLPDAARSLLLRRSTTTRARELSPTIPLGFKPYLLVNNDTGTH